MGWLIKGIVPVFGVLSTYLTAFTWISFTAGKEKRKIRNVLGQYVSPAILSSVLTDRKNAFLDAEVGQRKVLTIQFSDLRGFTSIAEQYPVEQVVGMLNDYLASMVDVIFEYQGTLDKFIGDAILAFWGAPIVDDAHAYKAVCCALDMHRTLKHLNKRKRIDGFPDFKSGFGIHTGEVILGNIGSRKKLDYTVIGDGVNLASRLESLTKQYQCPIILSEQTYEFVRAGVCCRIVDKVKVKGKDRCTAIYEAVDRMETVDAGTRQIVELTNEGFEHYCNRQFAHAAACYRSILQIKTADGLSRKFLDRCINYEQSPPPLSWEGECVLDQK
jgi:adenylate cyclase